MGKATASEGSFAAPRAKEYVPARQINQDEHVTVCGLSKGVPKVRALGGFGEDGEVYHLKPIVVPLWQQTLNLRSNPLLVDCSKHEHSLGFMRAIQTSAETSSADASANGWLVLPLPDAESAPLLHDNPDDLNDEDG